MLGVIAAIALLFEIHSRRAKKPNQSQTPILKPGSSRRSPDELNHSTGKVFFRGLTVSERYVLADILIVSHFELFNDFNLRDTFRHPHQKTQVQISILAILARLDTLAFHAQ